MREGRNLPVYSALRCDEPRRDIPQRSSACLNTDRNAAVLSANANAAR